MRKEFISTLEPLGLWTPDHEPIYTSLKPFLGDEGIMQVIDPNFAQGELEPQQAQNNFNKLKLLTTPLRSGKVPMFLLVELWTIDEILSILKRDNFNEILNFLELFSHGAFYDFLKDETRRKGFKEFVLTAIDRRIPNVVELIKMIIYNLKLFNIEIAPLDFRKIASEYDPAANYNISNKKTFLDFLNSFNIRPVDLGLVESLRAYQSRSASLAMASLSQSVNVYERSGAYGVTGNYFSPSYGYPPGNYPSYAYEQPSLMPPSFASPFGNPQGAYPSYNPVAAYEQPSLMPPSFASPFENPQGVYPNYNPVAAYEQPSLMPPSFASPFENPQGVYPSYNPVAAYEQPSATPTSKIIESSNPVVATVDPFEELVTETIVNLDGFTPRQISKLTTSLYTPDHQRFYSRLHSLGISYSDIYRLLTYDEKDPEVLQTTDRIPQKSNYDKLYTFFEPAGSSTYDRLMDSGYVIDLNAILKSYNWIDRLQVLNDLLKNLIPEKFKLLFSKDSGLGFTKQEIVATVTNYDTKLVFIEHLKDFFLNLKDSKGNIQFLLSLNFNKQKIQELIVNRYMRHHFRFIFSLRQVSPAHAPKTKYQLLMELGFTHLEQFTSLLASPSEYKNLASALDLLEDRKIYRYLESPVRRKVLLNFLFNTDIGFKNKIIETFAKILKKYGDEISDDEFTKILYLRRHYNTLTAFEKVLQEARLEESFYNLKVLLSRFPTPYMLPISALSLPSTVTSSVAAVREPRVSISETALDFFGAAAKRARVEQVKNLSREDAIQNIIKTQSDLQSKLSSNFLIDIGVYNDSEHDLIVTQMQLLNRISSLAIDSPEFKTLLKEYHANVKEQQYHKIWRVLTPEEQNIQKLEDLIKELDTGPTPSTQFPK